MIVHFFTQINGKNIAVKENPDVYIEAGKKTSGTSSNMSLF